MKMKEFGPPGGACPWRPPLDPPMRIPYSWIKTTTSLQIWSFSWMDFGSDLAKNTSPPPPPGATQIGTSYGGLRDFGFELTKNTPPPPKPRLEVRMNYLGTLKGTGVWKLIAVFPADTVSLLHYTLFHLINV